MTAYYNEIDPVAAQWLRNLIIAGLIAPGVVDERDIRDIVPNELRGYKQCHFFAGIGIWSHALRTAGWSDDRPVWTGSCPCQPFSAAGGRAGIADERHLWPHWHHLIRECRPAIVLGEQVASKDGLGWLDLVSADMEGTGYAVGASDLCAAGFGGAHIRQRLYFVGLADANGWNTSTQRKQRSGQHGQQPSDSCGSNRLADTTNGDWRRGECGTQAGIGSDEQRRGRSAISSGVCGLADADSVRHKGSPVEAVQGAGWRQERNAVGCSNGRLVESAGGSTYAPMLGRNPADWLYCRDGKWRPVRPGTFPLVDAAPARMGRLRAYGNGLDAETATRFIEAVMTA